MRRNNNPVPVRKTGKLPKNAVTFGHHSEVNKLQGKTNFGTAINALNDVIESYASIDKPLSAIEDGKRYELISEAIRKCKLGLFEQYIQSDCDYVKSACNSQFSIPLIHIAAQNSNLVYLEKLIQIGVSPNQLDEGLNTPAFHCVLHLNHILLLHRSGCNLNAKNRLGNTILHNLASAKVVDLSLFRQYVDLGCDPTIQNNKGISALNLLNGSISVQAVQEILRIYHWYKAKTILFLKKHEASILERIPQGIVREIIEYL
jgi:hypothetical protein